MVYPGFGVNYNNSSVNWNSDQLFLNLCEVPIIRISLPTMPSNGSVPAVWSNQSSLNNYRAAAQSFINAGFYVTTGLTFQPISANNWPAYHDFIVAEATYLQSQGIAISEFEVGNELEHDIQPTINTLTQSGGVATATINGAWSFSSGESVTITGATPSGYNGTFVITVTGPHTFTYSVSSSLTSPATGSVSCYDITISTLHSNIRQLATDVKAVYTLGLVSYACTNDTKVGISTYTEWISSGLGNLDTLSIHTYGNVNVANQTVGAGGLTSIASMVTAFGNQCYVSEFNLDSTASNIAALNPIASAQYMTNFLNMYLIGQVSKFLVYEFVEANNNSSGEYGFAQLKPTGDMNPMWFTFFEDNPTQYSTGNRALVSRNSVSRNSVARTSYERPLFN